jgi:threonine dehydratase
MNAPTLHDIYVARSRVARRLRPTPLVRHPLMVSELGCEVYVKHENHNPTGAFKIRGGLNLVSTLGTGERASGVVTASTGNHGQSIAMACGLERVPCAIYVPVGNNAEKNAAMRGYGAALIEHGKDFDEARERCEQDALEHGSRYVHPANEPLLVAGVATYALEVFEELPRVDAVFVPIGGGSGASGSGPRSAVLPGSSVSRPSAPTRSPDRGGPGCASAGIAPTRSPKGSPPG